MKNSVIAINAAWTVVIFGVRQAIRLLSNIVLARLLFPEAFGIMALVNSFRIGMELLSDVGIGQFVVRRADGENPEFLNAAWTIQVLRGIGLTLLFAAAAPVITSFYDLKGMEMLIVATASLLLIAGFQSPAVFVLQKRNQVRNLELFHLGPEALGVFITCVLAYLYPSVWALVWGSIIGLFLKVAASQFLSVAERPRFFLNREYAREILGFGKWVFLGSVAYFAATNFDRLYLAKAVTLEVLGVFGVAKALGDVVTSLTQRLNNLVVFPTIAALSHLPPEAMKRKLAASRFVYLTGTAVMLGAACSASDIAVDILYDDRYAEAGWMLTMLLLGQWFSVLANLSESMFVGMGRPALASLSNWTKLGFLLVSVPLAFGSFGLPGAIAMISASDLPRYLITLPAQVRAGLSFLRQDVASTLVLAASILAFSMLRHELGFGAISLSTSFGGP